MPRPKAGLIPTPTTVSEGQYEIKVRGLLKVYDSIHDTWQVFAVRTVCQGEGCDFVVDQPINKRPAPSTESAARIMLAGLAIEPRGCIRHPPSTWVRKVA